tara:strand:+ start:277 stop:1179 length:903 start_codon:yes stop_codon:yes gene_type:complete
MTTMAMTVVQASQTPTVAVVVVHETVVIDVVIEGGETITGGTMVTETGDHPWMTMITGGHHHLADMETGQDGTAHPAATMMDHEGTVEMARHHMGMTVTTTADVTGRGCVMTIMIAEVEVGVVMIADGDHFRIITIVVNDSSKRKKKQHKLIKSHLRFNCVSVRRAASPTIALNYTAVHHVWQCDCQAWSSFHLPLDGQDGVCISTPRTATDSISDIPAEHAFGTTSRILRAIKHEAKAPIHYLTPAHATTVVEGDPRGSTERITNDVLHRHIRCEYTAIIHIRSLAERRIRSANIMVVS